MGLSKEFLKKLEVPHESGKHLSILQNPDLEPMPPNRRTWGFWSYAGYWGVLNISIWTFSVGSSLLSLGLNIQHAMAALTIGNILIVLYTILNSYPGQVYHIGFTVCQRIVFGVYGSGLGILIRIILSITYFGSQAWLAGLCVTVMLSSITPNYLNMENSFPESVKMSTRDFVSFLIVQIISIPFFLIKPEKINIFVNASCVMALAGMVGMFGYMVKLNGGPGSVYYEKVTLSNSEFGWMYLMGINVWYGALSPDICNQSDFSRFSSSKPKLQWGIFCGIFFTEIIPLAGLICASISTDLYGKQYWLPTDICLQWLNDHYTPRTRCACFFLGLSFLTSELSLNTLTNGFAGGMDLAGLCPKYINITRGSIITALLSWIVQPWLFYNTSSTFLGVMSSFGVVVTPIIAIIVSDFMLVRGSKLKLNDLYTISKEGSFYHTAGVNWRAVFVFFASVVPGLPGMAAYVNPSIKLKTSITNYFYGSTVFSFFCPLILYYVLSVYIFPIKDRKIAAGIDLYNAFTLDECKRLNLIPYDGVNPEEVIVLEDFTKDDTHGGNSTSDSTSGIASSKEKIKSVFNVV